MPASPFPIPRGISMSTSSDATGRRCGPDTGRTDGTACTGVRCQSEGGGCVRGWSVYGCGLMQLGLRRDWEGRLETTRWLTLFYLPLVPLSRWRVRFIQIPLPMPKEDETFEFEPLERLPLD